MMPAEKGRALWRQLHSLALCLGNPSYQQIFFERWFSEVQQVIGCQTCFKKLARFLQLWPVEYGQGFQLWAMCLHDYVNKELGKKLFYPELTLGPLTARGLVQ